MLCAKSESRLPTDIRYLCRCIFKCLDYAGESKRKLGCACADSDCRRDDANRIHSNIDDANDSSADAGSHALAIEIRARSLVAYTASFMLFSRYYIASPLCCRLTTIHWLSGPCRLHGIVLTVSS